MGFALGIRLLILSGTLGLQEVEEPPHSAWHLDLAEDVFVRVEAGSFDELVLETRPTLTWNGYDMLWVTVDASGKPATFTLDRAYRVEPLEARPRWALIDYAETVHPVRVQSYIHAEAPVQKELTGSSGLDNQGLILAEDRLHGTLYRIYWMDTGEGGSGGYRRGRWILVHRSVKGSYTLIGEVPGDWHGRCGDNHSVGSTMQIAADWTGDPRAPARIRVTEISHDHQQRAEPFELPSLEVRRDGVLEEKPPAQFQWTPEKYLLAEANDSWSKIALRLAVWNVVGWDLKTPEEREEILRRYEEALKGANPDMKEDPVEGTRVGIVEDVGPAAK